MQPTKTCELCILKAGDHLEDTGLRAVFQLRLETDHIVERAKRIILTQLHDRIGFHCRVMLIGKAHWLHRPMAQCFGAAFGHDFNRQAAVEIGRTFPFLELSRIAFDQCCDKSLILVLIHGAVDVILAGASGADLVVARLEPANIHIDRIKMHNRRNRIEKCQCIGASLCLNGFSQ